MTVPTLHPSALLKEAGLTALVALALAVPLAGLRTVEAGARLTVETRFVEVAIAVALVFAGRLGLALTREGRAGLVLASTMPAAAAAWFAPFPTRALTAMTLAGVLVLALRAALALRRKAVKPAAGPIPEPDRQGLRRQRIVRAVAVAAVAFAAVLPLLPIADRGLLDIAILLLTYIMLGWGLNIIVGYAGLLDLGYVAFYAVGAYSYALLAVHFGLGFWLCLPLAGVLAALSGLLLGFPVLRLRGDYFAIVTLGFGEIVRVFLLNWVSLTGGPNGLLGIPAPSFFGLATFKRTAEDGLPPFHALFGIAYSPLNRIVFLYYLILALALLVNLFTLRIRRLPIGRAWEALREDDIACTALGINRTRIKLAAFGISAMWGGFAGAFFATRQGFVSPESFTFIESAMVLAIVVLGGMGSQTGVVAATLLVIGLPELFRELAEYRMLAFGMGMVLIMLWRPQGLLAHRDPTILLNDVAAGDAGRAKPAEARA